jgi:hypothetical protein
LFSTQLHQNGYLGLYKNIIKLGVNLKNKGHLREVISPKGLFDFFCFYRPSPAFLFRLQRKKRQSFKD